MSFLFVLLFFFIQKKKKKKSSACLCLLWKQNKPFFKWFSLAFSRTKKEKKKKKKGDVHVDQNISGEKKKKNFFFFFDICGCNILPSCAIMCDSCRTYLCDFVLVGTCDGVWLLGYAAADRRFSGGICFRSFVALLRGLYSG
jgi:hypothetical protein